jgi:hypothetical protein
MNKTALMNYALSARKELESQIALSLNKLGIYEDSIKRADIVGDYTIIEGTEETFPKRVYELRNTIISDHIQPDGFKNVVEEFAYTWFNRIIAIRFMEVHDYFDHGFRVLTSRDGSYEPEILKNLPFVSDELKIDKNICLNYERQGDTEGLYRYVLFQQCKSLGEIIPLLFGGQEDCLELVLPSNLLSKESVIRKIEEVPEEDFLNDVEVVGWLYQFYVASNREEFRHLSTVTKETLPTLSQVFTPDWIVRFLAQNSLGRLWTDNHQKSKIANEMPFLVKGQQSELRNPMMSVEKIRIIEPCCGSGHILVYLFDLLFEMYKEEGYEDSSIPREILTNNLFGLDIDKRAVQLSQFALLMKARSKDKKFFAKTREVIPHVYEIDDTQSLAAFDYKTMVSHLPLKEASKKTLDYLVQSFSNAKIIGSLQKVSKDDYSSLLLDFENVKGTYVPNLFEAPFFEYGIPKIINLCKVAEVLSDKYDILITNPPYCGISKMGEEEKKYFLRNYPASKNDLFSMFMDTDLVNQGGLTAIVNPDSWMFLSTFEKLREKILDTKSILALAQIGLGAFDATVQTTMYVLANKKGLSGSFFKLDSSKRENKESDLLSSIASKESPIRFENTPDFFESFPGKQIAFWIRNKQMFSYQTISHSFVSGGRNKTHDNEKYVRYWWEVNDFERWRPYANGGDFRRWYGNRIYVVDWSVKARESYDSHGGLYNPKFWNKEGVCWNLITSYKNSFRIKTPEEHFSSASPTIISNDDEKDLLVLGFLNTEVAAYLLNVLNPTLNTTVGDVLSLPYSDDGNSNEIIDIVRQNIDLTKEDWDSSEISNDFSCDPLVSGTSIKEAYIYHKGECEKRFDVLKRNEQRLNDIFASSLKITDVTFAVLDKDISILIPSEESAIKSLISFLVGVCFGRFKISGIDTEDCVYSDGVAPIFNFVGMDNGLTEHIVKLISKIFGKENLSQNLDYLSVGLGKKNSESSIDSLNRYLNEDFFVDHVKKYYKRPIYWMFSSGKEGAFKCLIYIQKYNENSLALINSKYFLPRTALYKSEKERLEGQVKVSGKETKALKDNEQELNEIVLCQKELFEYGQILDHMANQFVDLDINDGVQINYDKLQKVVVEMNGQTIKKNLLVPIK